MWRPINVKDVMEDSGKKWDYKTIGVGGVGGAALVTLLMNFQQQGIDLISKNTEAKHLLSIQKTDENARRIDRIEMDMKSLNQKLDNGFESVRNQIRKDVGDIYTLLRKNTSETWTRAQHISYRDEVDRRLSRIEERLDKIKSEKTR